jgi:adenosylhomocysteine nucleosidase
VAGRRVLFVAAEAREFTGLMRRIGGRGVDIDVAFAWTVDEWMLVAHGPGPRLARHAIRAAVDRFRPDAIVSTGLCGALAPELKIGSILAANKIIEADRDVSYAAQTPACHREFATGVVISMDRVACTVSEKRSLRSRGADVVEMEAAAVASYARDKDLSFFCIRAVSDTADDELPLDFNRMRGADGRFSRLRIITAALWRPIERIPALMRLDRDTRAAAESLGEFLVDCRF